MDLKTGIEDKEIDGESSHNRSTRPLSKSSLRANSFSATGREIIRARAKNRRSGSGMGGGGWTEERNVYNAGYRSVNFREMYADKRIIEQHVTMY